MTGLVQDFSLYAAAVAQEPGFHGCRGDDTGAAIGANTTMYSMVYGVLLRRLPFKDPARLNTPWGAI